MEGGTVNMLAYGCECTIPDKRDLRNRLDEIYYKWVGKIRSERNKPS